MLRSLRSSLARFAVRRAAACRPAPGSGRSVRPGLRRRRRGGGAVAQCAGAVPSGRGAGGGRGAPLVGDAGAWRHGAAVGSARGAARGKTGGWGEAGELGAGRRGWAWWYEGLRVPTRRRGVLKDAGLRERPSGRNRAELGLSVPYNTTFSRRITLYRLSVRRYSDTAYASRITAGEQYPATQEPPVG